ncbi:DNA-formamidopyrimidine glycosylase family protein [uncultured Chitinophaga sp.]|jgi:Formamidopyrimidine-DNA glycosylase|uniref:Fpg/Nei family DNA glycosylase n=1 Tax=uncultured Chitinophaga sp. TaxID=339340 RepID=UPI002602B721|nr:DNA-formamidopyrimidine glycosylase family protein [uncultured Chitinophaga sp.]
MPELPDLQVFSRNLNKLLKGRTVKAVTVPTSKKLNVPLKTLQQSLEGQELKKVERVGKELHFAFANGEVLGLHLMLRGQLHLFEKRNDHKNTIISLLFDNDTGLAMTDGFKAATPTLNPEERDATDALSKDMDAAFLEEQLASTKSAVKNVLLDQQVIRGIGNAYADEILWEAGISPFSAANKIPKAKVKALAKTIKVVLQRAEKQILKEHPDIISGEIRDFMVIHNPKKTHSPGGAEIKHKAVGGRKTYYTDEQELYE